MANTGRVTQSIVEVLASDTGDVRLTQSIIEFLVGVGIECNSPPSGSTGVPYTHTFPAGGGDPPYTFSITAGALPTGLTLNAATGVVSGVPNVGGAFGFSITVTDSLGGSATAQCTINISTGTVMPIGGGTPQGIQGCLPRNEYDWCALAEALRLYRIRFPRACAIPPELCNALPWDDDFGANALPAQAVPLHTVRGIVTPAPAAGDQVILEYRVPTGYDALLAGIFHWYSGNGFVEGSGDILWRLQVNLRYVEDLGSVAFTLGSPQSPLPLTEGQILLSGQTVRYLVNVPNLSGTIQVGQSQISAGLVGFLWPR